MQGVKRMAKYPITTDGDTISISPKDMELNKLYPFTYKGDKFGAFKGSDNIIRILEGALET